MQEHQQQASNRPDAPGDQADAPPSEGRRQRCFTLRALTLGAVLTVVFALITPWNDWFLENTSLYLHYLPPAVLLVILVMVLVVNPLLGRRRFAQGELVVVVAMLLALGGVVSSGLVRYLPGMITLPATRLKPGGTYERLREPLGPEDQAAARARFERHLARRFARLDADGNDTLSPNELGDANALATADSDNDGAVSLPEYRAHILQQDPDALPDARWALPHELFLGIPPVGTIARDDPEYRYVVEGYLNGLATAAQDDVRHRARVTWTEDGQRNQGEALAGRTAIDRGIAGDTGFLDLETSRVGQALRGLEPGDRTTVDTGRSHTAGPGETVGAIAQRYYGDPAAAPALRAANPQLGPDAQPAPGTTLTVPVRLTVEAVADPPTPYWAWVDPLLAWAPLLLGAFIASIATAFVLRRQWIHHERLPYPIGQVMLSLLEPAPPRRSFNALFTNHGFWAGFVIVFLLVLWNGLARWGLVEVGFQTVFDFYNGPDAPFQGSPWRQAYRPAFLFIPRISFSIIALTFFLALDLSFSLWFAFVAINILFLVSYSSGIPLHKADVQQAGVGGYAVMCLLILWLGRSHYLALLRAAFTGRGDEQTRRTVPYVWALIIGAVTMVLALVSYGAGPGASTLAVLLFLGFMLVVSRIVAETGIPFIQVPNEWTVNSVLFSAVGFSMPPSALMPLTLIGISLMADTRESLMPYAVQTSYLADHSGAPPRRTGAVMLVVVCIGMLIAGASMLRHAYSGDGPKDTSWPGYLLETQALKKVAGGIRTEERAATDHAAHAHQERQQQRTWTAYGAGAGLVATLGVLRMFFAWWPLHPIGFLAATSYPAWLMWFSFLLGWAWKAGVMRYGGSGAYHRLKAVAIGMIAGEMTALILFIILKIANPDRLGALRILG